MHRLIFLGALLLINPVLGSEEEVAATFAKAAIRIFDEDFLWEDPESTFTSEELEILANHTEALDEMIGQALGVQNSVVGAELMAYFGLETHTPFLRARLLEPGRVYGWEGPDYSDEENSLTDSQFVYHSRYLSAFQKLHGPKFREILALSDREMESIREWSLRPESEHYHWAIWFRRKIGF